MRLAGKGVLITGAAGGIGSALAKGLAAQGARVAVHDLTIERATRGLGDLDGVAVAGDVTDVEQVDAFVEAAEAGLGRIDVLVNNAGVMSTTPLLETTPAQWRRVIDINVNGYFLVGQAVAERMVATGGGSIVNVSSTRQTQAFTGNSAYATSKGAIAMLTRSFALELAPLGVRVNSVAPGTFVTDLNRHYLLEPDFRRERQARIPMGRYGGTEELVGAVVHLASDESSFTTGASLMVDGGQTLW